jgi:hypothetical protein
MPQASPEPLEQPQGIDRLDVRAERDQRTLETPQSATAKSVQRLNVIAIPMISADTYRLSI